MIDDNNNHTQFSSTRGNAILKGDHDLNVTVQCSRKVQKDFAQTCASTCIIKYRRKIRTRSAHVSGRSYIIRPHCLHAVHRCSLFLVSTDVALSVVCMYVCLCA